MSAVDNGVDVKTYINWEDAPKIKGLILVGHAFNKIKKLGHFGQWVYISKDATMVSFRPSPYFTPATVELKNKRFFRYAEKAEAE